MSLSLCSINVRGIRHLLKRKAIFLYCKRFNADFYFLQETHACSSDLFFGKNQWGNDIWLSYGNNHSAGVAVLRGAFKGKVISSKTHHSGRWLMLTVNFNSEMFLLGSIYASNNKPNRILFQEFEEEINRVIGVFQDIKIILGGDFNSESNVMIDRYPPTNRSCIVNPEFNNLCLGLRLVDIWRSKYPDKKEFTWSNKDMSRQSRIDFWLISNSLDNSVIKVSIEPSILTDHKVIFLSLNMNGSEVKPNRSYWKLNSRLLEDDHFKMDAKDIIQDNWRKAQLFKSFGKYWELMKYEIRQTAMKRGKEIAHFIIIKYLMFLRRQLI